MPFAIVVDSTCDLGPDYLATHDVAMVPLKVLFGDETSLDWIDFTPEAFYERLTSSAILPKTSQPSPAEFLETYDRLADEGADSIVSIHLTSPLSGTYESAMMAAKDAKVPVRVIDTKLVSQAFALVVMAAIEARDSGKSADEVAALAEKLSHDTQLFFVLDTLEYLVKGGRAGKAAGLAASLLNIKPVLRFNDDGIIEPFKKVKGRRKAFQELAARVAEDAAVKGRLRVGILHACEQSIADELIGDIEAAAGDSVEIVQVGLIGSVIGTYAGPGAVGCGYYPISSLS